MELSGNPKVPGAQPQQVASRGTYAGLFLVTLATLAFQTLLTRIFSVTLAYHFAFLAVSIGMLGMTSGAILVYLFPGVFAPDRVHRQLAFSSLVFAVAIVFSLLTHLVTPVITDGSILSIYSIVWTCLIVSAPFVASGVCVALALTRFPRQVSQLYAADLAGAAVGCVAIVTLLSVTDGPTAIVAAAVAANLGTLCFAREATSRSFYRLALVSAVGLSLFFVGHTVLVRQQAPLLRISWVRQVLGQGGPGPFRAPVPAYERWNSHSMIRVLGQGNKLVKPFGWSMSPTLPRGARVFQKLLDIDAGALTVMTKYNGSPEMLGYLKYDLPNLAHHLRSDADVLVIGAGGGRDVLSALAFDQSSVVAVEINAHILDISHRLNGDFTGHLDTNPKVTYVHDEGRSWVARSKKKFDIIQISMIDSWAATAAGAFVLTEHALYTIDAWKSFLTHLNDRGILTVTRYYFPANPGAAYRLTALAARALADIGADNPRDHIAIVRMPPKASGPSMATILVSRSPFSARDLTELEAVTDRMKFLPTLNPKFAENEIFEQLAAPANHASLLPTLPINVAPPTDDNPFFFHMLRFRQLFQFDQHRQGYMQFNMRAVYVLAALLFAVTILTLIFIFVPLLIKTKLTNLRGLAPWFLVFAGIGTGFMMIEISQLQRLAVFLGHPVYALTVVLFSLLLSSGLGSYSTERIAGSDIKRAVRLRLGLLLVVLVLFGALTPLILETFRGSVTPVRIAWSIFLLLPIGFFMGMPFPLSMKAASDSPSTRELTPWLWGINGATSVLASVVAIVIAMTWGISAAFWCGLASYVAATVGVFLAIRS
ncbi:MAG: hypothetical protein JRG80_11855 [Deltaproteobacteria bacterium]|nr:hypothetical protein [Deltaproteobacteria bacterium]